MKRLRIVGKGDNLMRELKPLETTRLEDLTVGVVMPEEYPTAVVFTFKGELHSLNADTVFTGIANPAGDWIGKVKAGETVVLDFYDLGYINSVGVGHIAQIAQKLHRQEASMLLVLNRESKVYPIFEYVGILEFPGVYTQYHPLSEGIDLPHE
ncbi:MAG: STAS domain-containing protein [Gemmatimonadetes bacterium]|nr:MAG: STAS domain-containing protein [Gemmatimonadota bacterium]